MAGQLGYDDTPIISGHIYRVHDSARPQPRVVTPPTDSAPERPGSPPSDAVVLFDGTDGAGWVTVKDGRSNPWAVQDGCMEVAPGTGDIASRAAFGSCQLHLEWAAPAAIKGESQGRGNSGVFLMGRYEIQVLDSFANPTYADGTTGAIYGQVPPLVNACRRPGEWQSYDIVWVAPRFDGDCVITPARVTVFLNGLVIQHDQELLGPTRHRVTTHYEAHADALPLHLQDHGDLVRYRNIWFRPLKGVDA